MLTALRESLETVYTPEKYTYTVMNNLGDGPAHITKQINRGNNGSSVHQQELESDDDGAEEEEEEAPLGSSKGKNGNEDVEIVPTRDARASFEIRSASPSTSGQEKRPKSDLLNLLSFKMRGAKTVTGGGKGADFTVKSLSGVRRDSPAPKIMQSRLTSFVSTSSQKANATTERY